MFESPDMLIFWAVVMARFIVPLFIPKFPLPTIILALVIDAIDQTIFQTFTDLNLDNYQSYDKALDIYYLVIAYLAIMRNWTNPYAIAIAKFLIYYRLIGVTIFELTYDGEGPRWLLFIFPNVFEYFFIFYEAVRTRWDPRKISKKFFLISAALIWIFIKLPQEYWIHIAQNDVTDTIKSLFGYPSTAKWSEIFSNNLWIFPVVGALAIVLVIALKKLYKKLPSPDYSFRLKYGLSIHKKIPKAVRTKRSFWSFLDKTLLEKTSLISLVVIIFVNMLPDTNARASQLFIAVGTLVVLNAGISSLLVKDKYLKPMPVIFLITLVINIMVVNLFSSLLGTDGNIDTTTSIFFVSLLSLLVALYDGYRPIYEKRFGLEK